MPGKVRFLWCLSRINKKPFERLRLPCFLGLHEDPSPQTG